MQLKKSTAIQNHVVSSLGGTAQLYIGKVKKMTGSLRAHIDSSNWDMLPAQMVSKPGPQEPSAEQGSAPTSRQLVHCIAWPGLQQPAAPPSTFDSSRCEAFHQATAG